METQICIRPVNNTYPHPHHTPRPHTHTIHPHTLLTPPPPLPAPISIPTFPTARPDSKTSLDKTRLLHTYLAAIPSNFPSSLGLSPCAQGQGTREENQARSRTSPAPPTPDCLHCLCFGAGLYRCLEHPVQIHQHGGDHKGSQQAA